MIKEMNLRLRQNVGGGQSTISEEGAEQCAQESSIKYELPLSNNSNLNRKKQEDSLSGGEMNGVVVTSSRFLPISPLSKSNNNRSCSSSRRKSKGRTSNLIHRIRFASKDQRSSSDACSPSTVSTSHRPQSPASSSYSRRSFGGGTNMSMSMSVTSNGSSSMIKSVKRALKPSRKNKFKCSEEESKGLLAFEEEHEHEHDKECS